MMKNNCLLLCATALSSLCFYTQANASINFNSEMPPILNAATLHTQHIPHFKPKHLSSLFSEKREIKVAQVCFITDMSECEGIHFAGTDGTIGTPPDILPPDDNGDDYKESCTEMGYGKTSCPEGYSPNKFCPLDEKYFAECKQDCPTGCKECEEHYKGVGEECCPGKYMKCECNECKGYDYTENNIPAGYIKGDSCESCDGWKYKIIPNPCTGFLDCDGKCATGSDMCLSGDKTMCEKCPPCPNACTLAECPANAVCDKEECSGRYCRTDCADGYEWDETSQSCKQSCDDTCPSGYFKDLTCNFGSSTQTTACGTTCYKCKEPSTTLETGIECRQDCPEGYTYNTTTNDYECKPLTCGTSIKARYPSYTYGPNSSQFCLNFDSQTPFVINNALRYCYNNSDTLHYTQDVYPYSRKVYAYADFGNEIAACKDYCRPEVHDNRYIGKTIQIKSPYIGAELALDNDETQYEIIGNNSYLYNITIYAYKKPITISGTFTNDSYIKNAYRFNTNVTIKANTKLGTYSGNATVEPNVTFNHLTFQGDEFIIKENTATTPITIKELTACDDPMYSEPYKNGNTSKGLYLNFEPVSTIDTGKLNLYRNTTGKIKYNLPSTCESRQEQGIPESHVFITSRGISSTMFKNPGPDVEVNLTGGDCKYSSCIFWNNRYVCAANNRQAKLTFLSGGSYKLPRCCSEDPECPEGIWNGTEGHVKCEGATTCHIDDRNTCTD